MSKKKKIKFAERDHIKYLESYVQKVLEILGHPEALVSDLSIIGDFMGYSDYFKNNITINCDKQNKEQLQKISDQLGFEVKNDDYIWEVAKKLLVCYR